MNRAERIYRLHALLRNKRFISLQRMMDVLEASRATVVRDLGYMRDFMSAPIIYDRGRNGYFYDPEAPEFELPGLWFNASELYALLATDQLMEAVQPGLLTPYIGPLKARIRSLLQQSGHNSDTVTSRIRLRPMAMRSVDSALFEQAAAAVLQGRVLDIRYHGRERDASSQRRVHPYMLVHYRNNWYLPAWCETAKALRIFSLDRVREAAVDSRPVKPISEEVLDRYLGASFGIFTGPARAWAVLRFTEEAARWVADEQWHPDQIGQWKDKRYELQVPYSDPRELLMDVLRYGPEVEVVAPNDLRRLVADRLHSAAAQYEP